MKSATLLCLNIVFLTPAFSAEAKVKLEDLPSAVQSSVKEITKDATLVGLNKEQEKGQTIYEVETKGSDGKTRDLLLDRTGAVIETEQEVDLDSIPAAAKMAIQEKAGRRHSSKSGEVDQGFQR